MLVKLLREFVIGHIVMIATTGSYSIQQKLLAALTNSSLRTVYSLFSLPTPEKNVE